MSLKTFNHPETTLCLFGPINTESLDIIVALREIASEDPKSTIRLVLSSEGGLEDVGYAIYDTLKALPNRVITEGYGEVSSIAALIFQAGDVRLLSPNCTYMIHNGSVEVGGHLEIDAIEDMAGHFKRRNIRYYQTIANRCKISVNKVKNWCKEEKFFTASEAVKEKIADGIAGKI